MTHITWEAPLCGEGNNCFRFGTDGEGNAYIAVRGREEQYVTDSVEALRALVREIKAGKADHLL